MASNPYASFDSVVLEKDNPYKQFDKAFSVLPAPPEAKTEYGILRNAGAGALKGAADIGATLLMPYDYLKDKVSGTTGSNADRRAQLGSFFADNANPESLAFKGGDLATSIAGTAGVGGTLAKGVLVAAPNAIKLANALESGGFALGAKGGSALGNAATRVAGGATTGAVSGALVNPEDAGQGAVIGGALPGVGKVVGMGASAAGKQLAKALQVSPEVANLAIKAKEMGIEIPLDRIVNSNPLNAAAATLKYLPFSGRAATENAMESQLQKATSRTFGQDTDNLTQALRNAQKDLGGKFETTLKNNTVKIDDQFLSELTDHLAKAKSELSADHFGIINNQVEDIIAKAKDGIIDGQAAYNIKKTLDRIGNRNSNEAYYAGDIKRSLMGALDRSLGPEQAKEFAKVRQQYGAMLDLEPLAKNGAEGDISIARLANLKNTNNPDLQNVADIASQFVKKRENDHGAAQRAVIGLVAATAGHLTGTVPYVAGGATGGKLANMLLNSQSLKNAALTGQSPQVSQALIKALQNPALRSLAVNSLSSPGQ